MCSRGLAVVDSLLPQQGPEAFSFICLRLCSPFLLCWSPQPNKDIKSDTKIVGFQLSFFFFLCLFQREVTIDREACSSPVENKRRRHGSQERTNERKEPHNRDNRDKKEKGKNTSSKVNNSRCQNGQRSEARRLR